MDCESVQQCFSRGARTKLVRPPTLKKLFGILGPNYPLFVEYRNRGHVRFTPKADICKTVIFQVLARDFQQKFQILRRYRASQRLGNTEKAPNTWAFSHTFGTKITRAELGAGVAVQIIPCSAPASLLTGNFAGNSPKLRPPATSETPICT